MTTQRFKSHFESKHLQAGETYTTRHRDQWERAVTDPDLLNTAAGARVYLIGVLGKINEHMKLTTARLSSIEEHLGLACPMRYSSEEEDHGHEEEQQEEEHEEEEKQDEHQEEEKDAEPPAAKKRRRRSKRVSRAQLCCGSNGSMHSIWWFQMVFWLPVGYRVQTVYWLQQSYR